MKVFATINDETVEVDIVLDPHTENRYTARIGDTEHEVLCIEPKPESLTLSIDGKVGFFEYHRDRGKIYETVFGNRSYKTVLRNPQQDQLETLLEQFGAGMGGSASDTRIKAPMPGKVLGVQVKPGDRVELGQIVLVLEAMKMENELGSMVDGIVKAVLVKPGDTVMVGDVLIETEPLH
jgi:biotin carboxyl carrier protein